MSFFDKIAGPEVLSKIDLTAEVRRLEKQLIALEQTLVAIVERIRQIEATHE